MNNMLRPTGLLLVGAIFICLSLTLNAAGSVADLPDLQKEMKKSLSDTITFPWSERYTSGSSSKPLMLRTPPLKEKMALNETAPEGVLHDLTAINSILEREVSYEGSQDGDRESAGRSNSLEISVTGQEIKDESISWNKENVAMDIERVVDDALNRDRNYSLEGHNATRMSSSPSLGNNMIIDVSGISVSAINTVKGGSATATSNIIIRPVQIIVCPSEVEEKLK